MEQTFEPQDADFANRIAISFERQGIMRTLGITLDSVRPGQVELGLPIRDELCQQHGYLHAGVVTTMLDTAGGLAALTLMPVHAAVLAVEFKANFMAPAKGERLEVSGRVVKPGRTLTICSADAYAWSNGTKKHVSTMLSTVMTLQDRGIEN